MYSYFAYYGPCILSIYLFSPTGLERQFTFYKSLIPSQSGCLFYSRHLVIYSTLKTNKVFTHQWVGQLSTKSLRILFYFTLPLTLTLSFPFFHVSGYSIFLSYYCLNKVTVSMQCSISITWHIRV